MPRIIIETKINAKRDIVFDLSRSIDLHKLSTAQTNEEAIAGVTSGLIGLNESVTWRAKHFGFYQNLTSKVTAFERPTFFIDKMEKGIFKYFIHEHKFEDRLGQTTMFDIFEYASPLGILGKIADKLFLTDYMTSLLVKRNETIKEFAESDKWKEVLVKINVGDVGESDAYRYI